MALGPSVPAWRALADELATLCDRTGARQAVVMDAFNDLWCRASPLRDPQEAFDALARAIDSAKKPLRAGGRVDLTEAHVRAVSFAAVYVLLLFFDGEYQPAWVNAAVRRALPTIESLTTSLPPPEGTDPHAEARAQRQAQLTSATGPGPAEPIDHLPELKKTCSEPDHRHRQDPHTARHVCRRPA